MLKPPFSHHDHWSKSKAIVQARILLLAPNAVVMESPPCYLGLNPAQRSRGCPKFSRSRFCETGVTMGPATEGRRRRGVQGVRQEQHLAPCWHSSTQWLWVPIAFNPESWEESHGASFQHIRCQGQFSSPGCPGS